GRVDELFDDDPCGHEMNKRQKGLAQFLIPRGNTPKLLKVMEESFHLLASLVEFCIIIERFCPIALGGDDRHNILREELGADAMAVIALVHHRMGQRRCWRELGKHRLKGGALMTVAGPGESGKPRAFVATARLEFGV